MIFWVLLVAGVAATSFVATRWVRGYAQRSALFDLPNSRSMHTTPIPRGGGLAIVGASIAGLTGATLVGTIPPALALALIIGGAGVAVVGWVDDRRGVSVQLRLAVHVIAACVAVGALGGLPTISVAGHTLTMGIAGDVLAIFGIVWCTNLYNFMDGIDGLAATQAALTGLLAAVFLAYGHDTADAIAASVLCAGAAGFLPWNWSPAKIFMGDVGSGFIGFSLSALAISSEHRIPGEAVLFIVLLGIFVGDATITLARRAARGDRLHVAHRSHAYQRAVTRGLTHRQVTTAVATLDIVLAALALPVALASSYAPAALAAVVVLVAAAYLTVERLAPM